MLIFVPAVLIAARIVPAAHTLLFVLAVLAIVPLAALLSHATEAVSEKTGDAIGVAPAAVFELDLARDEVMAQNFSAALAILLIVAYGLGLLFSLKTHKELFASEDHGE
ncbi:MAG TPA: calcium/proton exchanger, partial [Bradyrhizobium sp.]|nr:calcium/proton exchanger [Bradyrhizobium sp.]